MKSAYERGYEAFWIYEGNPFEKNTNDWHGFQTGFVDASIDGFRCYIRSAK
tara:strand:- start:16763 stop:16915 length:153 start_codon:yes stop_codon:yes gene_type:complete